MINLMLMNFTCCIYYFMEKKWFNIFMMMLLSFLMLLYNLNCYFMVPQVFLFSNFLNFLMDDLSWKLIVLSILVIKMSLLSSSMIINYSKNTNIFMLSIFMLSLMILLCFMVSHFLILYIMFELSILPMVVLIFLWGYQPERILAIMYFFLYTCLSSLPFLMMILLLNNKMFSLSFMTPFIKQFSFSDIMKFILVIFFFVKCPVYGFHLWLPKAHVEAPVSGSVILAAVLLKFGGYGLIRILMSDLMLSFYGDILMSFFLWGAMMTCFICLCQLDLKSLIAYSSVSHMTLMCSALMAMNLLSKESMMGMMLSHGLTSMFMFIFANDYYEMTNTRSIFLFSGLMFNASMLTLWLFIILWSNSSIPPTINFSIELVMFLSIISFSSISYIFLIIVSSLTLAYMTLVFINSQYGESISTIKIINSKYIKNIMIFKSLWSYLFFFLMFIFMI